MSAADSSLVNTLTYALKQCEEQVEILREKDATISRLLEENERLKEKLRKLRDVSKPAEDTADLQSQLEKSFQRDADKQHEIDSLKSKLRAVRAKVRSAGVEAPPSSSPLPPSASERAELVHHTADSVSNPGSDHAPGARMEHGSGKSSSKQNTDVTHISKRPRSRSPQTRKPLQEISANASIGNLRKASSEGGSSKRIKRSDRGAAAIPSVAEDGEDHLRGGRPAVDGSAIHSRLGVNDRLGDLLTAPSPHRRPLFGSSDMPADQDSTNKLQRPSSAIPLPASPTRKTQRTAKDIHVRGRQDIPSAEDEEPLRSRPVQRLNMSHFKLNPKTNNGLDFAFEEVVRGRQRKCHPGCTRPECCGRTVQALVATLPKLPGQKDMTDHELLLDFLGPNSEQRIRDLTPTARENLLHEARTKAVANAYGKMHRNAHERRASPPGFWRTDMPGSQDDLDDRQRARAWEREEVRRRYQEALLDDGKWVFIDE